MSKDWKLTLLINEDQLPAFRNMARKQVVCTDAHFQKLWEAFGGDDCVLEWVCESIAINKHNAVKRTAQAIIENWEEIND